MAQQPLDQLTIGELKNKEEVLKKATPILGISLVLMSAASVFLTVRGGFGVFSILPVIFLPLFIANVQNLKKIKDELVRREQQ
ncbi:hypothetical protein [Lacibacter sp. H407]|uniref:hypothetical protein n=1 Tax=Lacibacter sp. H407 TaxID=3133423 RepID=UPI0030BB3D11